MRNVPLLVRHAFLVHVHVNVLQDILRKVMLTHFVVHHVMREHLLCEIHHFVLFVQLDNFLFHKVSNALYVEQEVIQNYNLLHVPFAHREHTLPRMVWKNAFHVKLVPLQIKVAVQNAQNALSGAIAIPKAKQNVHYVLVA